MYTQYEFPSYPSKYSSGAPTRDVETIIGGDGVWLPIYRDVLLIEPTNYNDVVQPLFRQMEVFGDYAKPVGHKVTIVNMNVPNNPNYQYDNVFLIRLLLNNVVIENYINKTSIDIYSGEHCTLQFVRKSEGGGQKDIWIIV